MKTSSYISAADGSLAITVEFANGEPTDLEILAGIDALLSSIPRAANVKDGKAHKDTLIELWPLFRRSQS